MNHLEEVKKYWNTRSEGYRLQIEKELREGQDEVYLPTFRKLPVGSTVLDVGCGPGYFTYLLTALGHHVTAFDYSEEMLRQAKEFVFSLTQKTPAFLRGDAQKLPFPSETFDAVVSRNLLWNLDAPEAAYAEWMRVLRPGGKLFVYDGNHYSHLYSPDYFEVHQRVEQKSNHILLGVQTATIDQIAKELPLSKKIRPRWDVDTLERLGAEKVETEVLKEEKTRAGKKLPTHFAVFATKK